MKEKLNTESFIKRAIEKHGDNYVYDETIYINYYTKLTITCPIHGNWQQLPNNHLKGHGCDKCAKKKLSTQFMSNAVDFILKANIVHNNKYDYSQINYKGNKSKIEIICLEHDIFSQTPANHLSGYGCPKCGGSYPLDKQLFVVKSNMIHNNKYSYELVNYTSNHNKVIIICQDHGQFVQEPAAHMRGQGCPKCGYNVSKSEIEWLDALNIDQDYRHQTIKIGNIRFWGDAYNPATNTIYEFNGDFWHGNPNKFAPNQINNRNKKTFGELYQSTVLKTKILIEAGYNVVSIWESDWKKEQKICKRRVSAA